MGLNSTEVSYGFGQMGSAFINDGDEYTPPTGSVVVAIQCLSAVTFDELVPDTSGYIDGTTGAAGVGAAAYIGTTAVVGANGTNAVALPTTQNFSKGMALFGRWTKVELGKGQVIMYLAPAI